MDDVFKRNKMENSSSESVTNISSALDHDDGFNGLEQRKLDTKLAMARTTNSIIHWKPNCKKSEKTLSETAVLRPKSRHHLIDVHGLAMFIRESTRCLQCCQINCLSLMGNISQQVPPSVHRVTIKCSKCSFILFQDLKKPDDVASEKSLTNEPKVAKNKSNQGRNAGSLFPNKQSVSNKFSLSLDGHVKGTVPRKSNSQCSAAEQISNSSLEGEGKISKKVQKSSCDFSSPQASQSETVMDNELSKGLTTNSNGLDDLERVWIREGNNGFTINGEHDPLSAAAPSNSSPQQQVTGNPKTNGTHNHFESQQETRTFKVERRLAERSFRSPPNSYAHEMADECLKRESEPEESNHTRLPHIPSGYSSSESYLPRGGLSSRSHPSPSSAEESKIRRQTDLASTLGHIKKVDELSPRIHESPSFPPSDKPSPNVSRISPPLEGSAQTYSCQNHEKANLKDANFLKKLLNLAESLKIELIERAKELESEERGEGSGAPNSQDHLDNYSTKRNDELSSSSAKVPAGDVEMTFPEYILPHKTESIISQTKPHPSDYYDNESIWTDPRITMLEARKVSLKRKLNADIPLDFLAKRNSAGWPDGLGVPLERQSSLDLESTDQFDDIEPGSQSYRFHDLLTSESDTE